DLSRCKPEELVEEVSPRKVGSGSPAWSRAPGIPEPPTETRIEHGQQESHRPRRVITAIWIGGGTRDRHRRPELRATGRCESRRRAISALFELAVRTRDFLVVLPR